jgi:hypothetical protein
MPVVNLNIPVDTNEDYTPEQLRDFLSRLIAAGKDFALNDEQAESDLADMMTEISVGDAELGPGSAWVTHVSHRHGDDLYLSATDDEARRHTLEYCLEWWGSETGGTALPKRDDFESFAGWADTVCSTYFDCVEDESGYTAYLHRHAGVPDEAELLARASEFWDDENPAEEVNSAPKMGM